MFRLFERDREIMDPRSTERPQRKGRGIAGPAIISLKLVVTLGCFVYLGRNAQLSQIIDVFRTLELRWLFLALVCAMLQIPLVACRWRLFVDAVSPSTHIAMWPIVAITAIGIFWGQVMPNVAGDGMRTWLLAKFSRSWMRSLYSVLLDRALGLYVLVAISLIALWLPAAYQLPDAVRMISAEILGPCAVIGAVGILFAPMIASKLQGYRKARWAVDALTAQKILLQSWTGPAALGLSFLVHGLAILAVYALAQAMNMPLSLQSAVVLFAVMMMISVIPIAIGGWGIREVAVTLLLQRHGIPSETALAFSLSFGFVFLTAALPGGLVFVLYRPSPSLEGAS
jgi:glycosyltransferase 2 family protein